MKKGFFHCFLYVSLGISTAYCAQNIDFSTMNNTTGTLPFILNSVYSVATESLGIPAQNRTSSLTWSIHQQLFMSLLFSRDVFFTKLVQCVYRLKSANDPLANNMISVSYDLSLIDQGLANAKEVINIFDDLHIKYLSNPKQSTGDSHKIQLDLAYTLFVNVVLEKDEKLGKYLWPMCQKVMQGVDLSITEQDALNPYLNRFKMIITIIGAVQENVPNFFVVLLNADTLKQFEQIVTFASNLCKNEESLNKFLNFFKLMLYAFSIENQKHALEN